MKLYYSDDYVAAGHDFDTTRKARRVATALRKAPIPGVELVEPAPVTRKELLCAHTPEYVDCVLNGGGYPNKPRRHRTNSFPWSPELVTAVLASTGGVLDAVAAALEDGVAGSLSSGLHHAHADRGGPFCTFNGLAVATRLAMAKGSVDSVLIIDLDAHFGDGTMAILGDDPGVSIIDVSGGGFMHRPREAEHAVVGVDDGAGYLALVEDLLDGFDPTGVDLVLYNAGMDPHEHCEIGRIPGVTTEILRQREELVFGWCCKLGLPVAFVLAGGYKGGALTHQDVVDLHLMTIDAAAAAAGAGSVA